MKSRLLAADTLWQLADADSLSALAGQLEQTDYRHHIEVERVQVGGPDQIVRALRQHLTDRLNKVHSVYSGHERRLVGSLLLRYEIHNIKTILRGLGHHAPTQSISAALLPVAELSAALLTDLRQAANPRAAIDLLASIRSPLAQPLLELRAEQPGVTVRQMELALERWYFQEMRRIIARVPRAARLVSDSVSIEADITNLLTVLRLFQSAQPAQAVDLETLLVEPGHLAPRQFRHVAEQSSVQDAIRLLENTLYGNALVEGLHDYEQSQRLSDFELALQRFYLRKRASMIVHDPLGIGVPLGYIALKVNEIHNLRWIAQGIGLGLSAENIKDYLAL